MGALIYESVGVSFIMNAVACLQPSVAIDACSRRLCKHSRGGEYQLPDKVEQLQKLSVLEVGLGEPKQLCA